MILLILRELSNSKTFVSKSIRCTTEDSVLKKTTFLWSLVKSSSYKTDLVIYTLWNVIRATPSILKGGVLDCQMSSATWIQSCLCWGKARIPQSYFYHFRGGKSDVTIIVRGKGLSNLNLNLSEILLVFHLALNALVKGIDSSFLLKGKY